MNYIVTKRLPCSVCSADTFQHMGWFLVLENRWLDQLKILSWHPTLAGRKDIKSACCREHLKTLIAWWLNRASLRLVPAEERPMPIAGNPSLSDFDLNPQELGQLLGELSVHRDAFSRGWTGSAETLESILDVLTPCEHVNQTYAMELQPFTTLHQPTRGLALR